jgi:hypothetical protein
LQKPLIPIQIAITISQDGIFIGAALFIIHLCLIIGIDHLVFIHGQDLVGEVWGHGD